MTNINNQGFINDGESHIEVLAVGNGATAKKIQYESATEIKRLLEQLEKLNLVATKDEQIACINISKSNLEKRLKAALKDGSETAIDEFLLENKSLKVIKAFLMGWLQPK